MREITAKNISEKEKGYLVGLFIGDGYANHNKKHNQYSVEFYLNSLRDLDIQSHVLKILTKLNLAPSVIKDKRSNCNRIRVRSKLFFAFMKSQLAKKDSKYHTPSRRAFLLGLLSGFIDAEAYVGNGMILIAQKNGKIMKLMQNICKAITLPCKIWHQKNYPKGRIWRGRISTKFKLHAHNSQKVARKYGFLSRFSKNQQ